VVPPNQIEHAHRQLAEEGRLMFVRNCWYAAGWSKDFELGTESKMMTIAIDSGVAQFHRMMDDLIRAEAGHAAGESAADATVS
jgi:hypothetical protein